MSTNAPPEQETSGKIAAPYTEHYEPPAQGGEKYVRCTGCGRELLTRLGGFENLVHADDCPHAEALQ